MAECIKYIIEANQTKRPNSYANTGNFSFYPVAPLLVCPFLCLVRFLVCWLRCVHHIHIRIVWHVRTHKTQTVLRNSKDVVVFRMNLMICESTLGWFHPNIMGQIALHAEKFSMNERNHFTLYSLFFSALSTRKLIVAAHVAFLCWDIIFINWPDFSSMHT